ncbi:Hypothetical predicted protein [Paramuricea clavata]|uniref:Uncharacterized protein n=1 Tax=Paramuricea clavata TaxID=317549 RepID=A0A6S7KE88_PARCT|nr:Hypothetical predicted protein [Paramuricea clavata]
MYILWLLRHYCVPINTEQDSGTLRYPQPKPVFESQLKLDKNLERNFKMMFKVLLIFAAVCASGNGQNGIPCPCGWENILNGCYLFVKNN